MPFDPLHPFQPSRGWGWVKSTQFFPGSPQGSEHRAQEEKESGGQCSGMRCQESVPNPPALASTCVCIVAADWEAHTK